MATMNSLEISLDYICTPPAAIFWLYETPKGSVDVFIFITLSVG